MARPKKSNTTATVTKDTMETVSNSSIDTAAEVTASAAVISAPTKTQSDTVVIALNYPRSIKFDVEINGVTEYLVVNGNATELRGKDMGILPGVGTYGLTFGVKRYLWEAVKAKYSGMPIFRSGLIFAQDTESEAKAAVADHSDVANGFEPQAQTL